PRPILWGTFGNKGYLDENGKLQKGVPKGDKEKALYEKVKHAVEFQEKVESAHEKALRAAQLAMDGVPVEGARFLLRHDPVLQGAKLFVTNCAVCHSYTAAPAE